MNTFIREYGLISLLLIIAVGGYFLLGEDREDILASSLDSLGQTLSELVDDSDAKARTVDSFESFKEKVAANEIAPEQVERIAANVLNLSTTGAKLSPGEADLVLQMSMEGEMNALPVPEAVVPEPGDISITRAETGEAEILVQSWTPESTERVGERLAAMVAFSDKMKEETSGLSPVDRAMHVQFVVQDGLQIVFDSVAEMQWKNSDLGAMATDLKRERRVIWDKNLIESRRKRAEYLKVQGEKISKMMHESGKLSPEDAKKMQAFEHLNRLQEMGFVLEMDSSVVRTRLDLILKNVTRQIERAIEEAEEGTIPNQESSS